MIRIIGGAAMLASASLTPMQPAVAQSNVLGSAIIGGTVGAILGGAVSGGRGGGIALGAAIGAVTAASIASEGEARPGGYYAYDSGCYIRSHRRWYAVDPSYCD